MKHRADSELDRSLNDMERQMAPVVQATFPETQPRPGFLAALEYNLQAARDQARTQGRWPERIHRWPGGAGLAAAMVGALLISATLLSPRLTPPVDAGALMNEVQNAADIVAPDRVRHLVTTYSMTPAAMGRSSTTLDQWFGNVNNRLVTRQTGLLGETTIVDAAGTRWTTFPETNDVLKIVGGSANLPLLTPNRVTMDGIGTDGAQPRVVGQTTVNGRAATLLELTRTLPTPPAPPSPPAAGSGPTAVFEIGVNGPPPGPGGPSGNQFFRSTGSDALPTGPGGVGAMITPQPGQPATFAFSNAEGTMLAVPSGGGTSVTTLTVDDQTRQILQGRAVSKDTSGTVFGTTEWRVTTDEVTNAASAPADLFVFTPAANATVHETAPDQPFHIQVMRP